MKERNLVQRQWSVTQLQLGTCRPPFVPSALVNPADSFSKNADTLQLAPGDFLFKEGDKRDHFLVQRHPHFATHVMKELADRLRHMNAAAMR